jgi:hypothetical protein
MYVWSKGGWKEGERDIDSIDISNAWVYVEKPPLYRAVDRLRSEKACWRYLFSQIHLNIYLIVL